MGEEGSILRNMDSLGEDGLQCIALHLSNDVQSLLRLGRASKRWYERVHAAEAAWQKAYIETFGMIEEDVDVAGTAWLEVYKKRFLQDARGARQIAAARRLRAISAVQVLSREVFLLQKAMKDEQQRFLSLCRELDVVQRCRQEDARRPGQVLWVPRAVLSRSLQGPVVEQVAYDTKVREETLLQRKAVSKLEVNKLRKMLSARQQALEQAEVRLKAVQQ